MAASIKSKNKGSSASRSVNSQSVSLNLDEKSTMITRLISVLALGFISFLLILTIFGTHALLLDAMRTLISGTIGYGYWMLPFAMIWMIGIILTSGSKPAWKRCMLIFAAVVILSAFLHVLRGDLSAFDGNLIQKLWNSGKGGFSGGILAGLLGEFLVRFLSRTGASILLVLILLAVMIVLFQRPIQKWIHNRAEEHRRLKELEPEEPIVPVENFDMVEDIKMVKERLAIDMRTKTQELRTFRHRNASEFDIDLSGSSDEDGMKIEAALIENHEEEEPDLLIPARKHEKYTGRPVKKTDKSSNPYDIPLGADAICNAENSSESDMDDWDPVPVASAMVHDENLDSKDSPDNDHGNKTNGQQPDYSTADLIEEMQNMPDPMQKISREEAQIAAAEVALQIKADDQKEKEEYQYPPMSMLAEAMPHKQDNTREMESNVRLLEKTLTSFNVDTRIDNVVRGPAITRYEMALKPGVKMNKITSLHEDIALALGVTGVHVAAVPGKNSTIGIEVPNKSVTSVPIREVLASKAFTQHKSALAFALGKDISGNYIVGDIAKMPHLLIAGTTGSGKSVCMNSIIVSLLYRDDPEQCRLIMIDPKIVELSIYNGIPHLLIPVVTDPKKAAGALQWAVTEMERRYQLFAEYNVRDMTGFNKKIKNDRNIRPLPRIVIIIDELADLMMVAAKEVETSIARLAQKARAAGMHLVIATQRPSADVITGVIKANIPSRIAFAVSSAMESNIIMGSRGAEKLVGKGDMFYAPQGTGKPSRVQGCFIEDEEVEKVAEFVKNTSTANYSDDIMRSIEDSVIENTDKSDDFDIQTSENDERLHEAVEVILDTKQASVSMLQRRMKLGYSHAARIMDELEELEIVGPNEGSKPRKVLITREQWAAMSNINPNASIDETESEYFEDGGEDEFD